jgi:hypothetical protein
MEVEQRYVIKFFMEEGMKEVEIINRLNKHYSRGALQQAKMYYWIRDVKSGRKHLSNITPPGRTPDKGLGD